MGKVKWELTEAAMINYYKFLKISEIFSFIYLFNYYSKIKENSVAFKQL